MIESHQWTSAGSDATHHPSATPAQYQFSRPALHNVRQYGRGAPASSASLAKEKSSLDLTQRLERKLAEYNASQNVFKRWLFEIASWLISALCMGAIIVIYAKINGKNMVGSEMLLNVANVFGKLASAALIVPTTEALGQLKWNWFHNSQAMWDFEIFDKASRGPWGAALLLFRTKGRSLAALGALLIVLLLAIDTFFQQVTNFPDRWALQSTFGEIPRAIFYDPDNQNVYSHGVEVSLYDMDLHPVIETFFYENGTQPVAFGNGTRPEIPLSCPTSNCTWPIYETLAVCSECAEVSHLLNITFACMNTTIDWSTHWEGPIRDVPYPNGTVCGHFLNATTDKPILLSGYSVNETEEGTTKGEALLVRAIPLTAFLTKERFFGVGSVAFKDTRDPIFDSLIVSATNGPISVYEHEPPIVNECALLWCVQTIKSTYIYGTYLEEVISEFHNTTTGPSPWKSWSAGDDGTFIVYEEDVSLERLTSGPEHSNSTVFNRRYGADNITASNVMANFDDFFPSYFTADNTSATPRLRYKDYLDGPSLQILNSSAWQAPNNLTHYLERLATAMTNVIRSSVSTEMLPGKAYDTETFVSIQWGWLSFPLLLLVLSLVFLVSTIIKTSEDTTTGIWKTSAMPTLIYGLPQETQSQLTSSTTWSSGKETKKVRIRLLPNMGWRVSSQNQLGTSSQVLPPPASHAPRGWI